ncbi:MAG: nitroreductase family protein [Oscillospiraceae bacterium]|jgi:nitroreductase/NAD-dependent dihydropyrimidine dehydrogenase PreA subunit
MLKINESLCVGCAQCASECFYGRIFMDGKKAKMGDAPCWDCYHCIGLCPVGAISDNDVDMSQVVPYDEKTFRVSPGNLSNLIKFRRSIRAFEKTPLSRGDLVRLLDAGRYSPTGENRQPIRYIVLQNALPAVRDAAIEAFWAVAQRDDPEEIERVYGGNPGHNDHWKRCYRSYREEGKDGLFYGAPTVVLAVAPKDELSILDVGIATSNIELMAAASGFGTCYIAFLQMACIAEPSLRDKMGIGQGEEILAVMALGRPALRFHRTVPRNELNVEWI